jgi:hypothetical protein
LPELPLPPESKYEGNLSYFQSNPILDNCLVRTSDCWFFLIPADVFRKYARAAGFEEATGKGKKGKPPQNRTDQEDSQRSKERKKGFPVAVD